MSLNVPSSQPIIIIAQTVNTAMLNAKNNNNAVQNKLSAKNKTPKNCEF